MRTTKDRIRHAVSFELIGLALVTPLGTLAFGTPLDLMGVVVVVGATLATAWNYLFNLGFDHAMQRWIGHTRKTVGLRIVHAVLFELGLLIVLLPFIAWYLQISVLHALAMDLSFAGFYMVYALVFNWAYDVVFPIPVRRVEKPTQS